MACQSFFGSKSTFRAAIQIQNVKLQPYSLNQKKPGIQRIQHVQSQTFGFSMSGMQNGTVAAAQLRHPGWA
jgi:hypothetical protein